jgi:hypothetical protein
MHVLHSSLIIDESDYDGVASPTANDFNPFDFRQLYF